jgi:hypothetical protein
MRQISKEPESQSSATKHVHESAPDPQSNEPIATRRERRSIKAPSRFAEAADDGWLDEADFAKLVIMFAQTLGENDEIVLLSDASDNKLPDVLVAREDSRDIKDPKSLQEAMDSPYWPQWLGAIHEETESLGAMHVYDEVAELPPGKRPIGSKFVFKVKRDEN